MAMLKLDFMKLFSSAFFITSTNWKEVRGFLCCLMFFVPKRLPSGPSLPELPPIYPLGLMTMGGASVLPASAPWGPRVSPKKRNPKGEFRIHMTPPILAQVCP